MTIRVRPVRRPFLAISGLFQAFSVRFRAFWNVNWREFSAIFGVCTASLAVGELLSNLWWTVLLVGIFMIRLAAMGPEK